MKNNTKGKTKRTEVVTREDITTVCYGHVDKWDSRAKAVKYFFNCANASEGAERARYVNVMMELMAGSNMATDGE